MLENITKNNSTIKNQNANILFLSTMEIYSQNILASNTIQRIQEWSLSNDEIGVMSELLNEDTEKILNDIDSGKEKLTKYSNSKEYLKHVEKVLDE